MKRLLFFLMVIFTALALLPSCGKHTTDEDMEDKYGLEETVLTPTPTPILDILDIYELLPQSTGIPDISDVIYDNDLMYTLEYQRELVGNIYLNFSYDDIFEVNGTAYLFSDYPEILIIKLTDEQCTQLMTHSTDTSAYVYSFRVDDVKNTPLLHFYPEREYAESWDYYDEYGDIAYDIAEIDSIYAYIDWYRDHIIYGTCVDVYFLEC